MDCADRDMKVCGRMQTFVVGIRKYGEARIEASSIEEARALAFSIPEEKIKYFEKTIKFLEA